MAGASLLTLLDDIATVLDDVAILSKVAVKKTAGVLGDDLALNAEQVAGVRAEREIPVVVTVAIGSFKNKLILVPAALLISAFIPWLITPLLMLGGAFLCYEGFEKVWHSLTHQEDQASFEKRVETLADSEIDLVQLEKDKIKGAIRTDFILSAEIIVIALGTVKEASFNTQVLVVSLVAIMITFVVYGLVALIVKMDDAGLYLLQNAAQSKLEKTQRLCGTMLLKFAPKLMKSLTYIGTVAMFLVGGGIIVHGVPLLAHISHQLEKMSTQIAQLDAVIGLLAPSLFAGFFGVVLGALLVAIHSLIAKMRGA